MLLKEFKNINSSIKELRKFAYTMGIVFLVIGIAISFLHKRIYPIPFIISAAFILSSVIFPKFLLPIQKLWMGLSIILGFVSTRIILTILYYVILTPIAVVSRLRGKDFLNEKIEKNKPSYWHHRSTNSNEQNNLTKQY